MDEFWPVIRGTVCINMNSHTVPTHSAHTGHHISLKSENSENEFYNQFHQFNFGETPNNLLMASTQARLNVRY